MHVHTYMQRTCGDQAQDIDIPQSAMAEVPFSEKLRSAGSKSKAAVDDQGVKRVPRCAAFVECM